MMSTDCWEPSGGYLTQDGYQRVLTHKRSKGGKLKMWHRLVWEIVNGDIPEGYEINHLCKNRKCCNIDHLEMLPRSEHRSRDNSERYRKRAEGVYEAHLANKGLKQRELAQMFGIAQSSVSGILKRLKD